MTALPYFSYLCTDVPFLGGSGLGDGVPVALEGIAELHSLLIFPMVATGAAAFYILGMALLGGRGRALRAAGLVGLGVLLALWGLAIWGACTAGEGYLLAALPGLAVPPISRLLVEGDYVKFLRAAQLGLYTQADYTAITLEGVPSLEYLVPGTAAFPESECKGLARRPKDPVRRHVGITLAATYIAGRLLLCFPAMLTLLQAVPRVGKPYPVGDLHLLFSPFTLPLAAVLIAAFGQLGFHPRYTLIPGGGLVLHLTADQIRALHAHYGAQGHGVKDLHVYLQSGKLVKLHRYPRLGTGPEGSLRFIENFLGVGRVAKPGPRSRSRMRT